MSTVNLRVRGADHDETAGTISGNFGTYRSAVGGEFLRVTPARSTQRIEEVLHDVLSDLRQETVEPWLAGWNDSRAEAAAEGALISVEGPTGNGWTDRYIYSPDLVHRLWFERRWEPDTPLAVVAGANAGTGDTTTSRRATLENAIKVIDTWTGNDQWSDGTPYRGPVLPKVGGIAFVNLYSFRSKDLLQFGQATASKQPNHPKADKLTAKVVKHAAWVFAAWGSIKASDRSRRSEFEKVLRDAGTSIYGATCTCKALDGVRARWLSQDLDPRHPLRMSDPHPAPLDDLRADASTPIWVQN